MDQAGLEPTTYWLWVRRSNQLSYKSKWRCRWRDWLPTRCPFRIHHLSRITGCLIVFIRTQTIYSTTPAYKFCNVCTVCVLSTLLLCFISFHFIHSVCSVIRFRIITKWRVQDSNLWPFECKSNALANWANSPLTYQRWESNPHERFMLNRF